MADADAVQAAAVDADAANEPVDTPGNRQFEAIRHALARRRRELGVSMSELARQVGVSPSMVSQIERGQTLPSVATLFSLAAALGATVDAFFADPEEDFPPGPSAPARPREEVASSLGSGTREDLYVVRQGHRSSIDIRGGVHWERLTPAPLDQLEFLELNYEPHAQSDSDLYRHPGIEMVVVIEGAFTIHVGFASYELAVGDSIAFPSSLPHRYVNPTDSTSRAVTVIVRDPVEGPPAPLPVDALERALGRNDQGKEST